MLYDCSDEYFDHRNKVSLEDLNEIEYMVHVLGGAFDYDASPSIEKDCGIKSGYHYFSTQAAMDNFLEIINKDEYKSQGLVKDIVTGVLSHK